MPDFADCCARCEMCVLRTFSLWDSPPRSCSGLGTRRGVLRAQNNACLRIYGFQGEAAEEGEW